ncbi:MAG: valine--tRNA ligase [Candidatus Gracilibacteria bacterium]|nr:valine--tRNA ligase [Candidatus Gracilibacteria bacterium]MDD3120695.1 valine--tRNA ligase [Candidatus Gracilibacteria bacterium]MDD4530421.1 valine--tRNA ligase [Candidatus Gracilibacteria bacterium]
MEFQKTYNPKQFEEEIYKYWEDTNKFKPKPGKTKKTFYIPIPPPNVTGNLHLGHAMTVSLEDIMTRYHRMAGYETLWVPGTDHAGISTQSVVEKKLAKCGIKRTDLGREKFLEEVWKWKNEYETNILGQIKKMGSSCDWTKTRFTLDKGLNEIVEYAFCDLYKKGLLYKGEYMVNYSPALETVLSDEEVEYKEEEAFLYYITYFVSGSDKELVVATTRPETMLADQAIAVHPKDKRFKKLIGRKVILPIVNKEIPIIGDEAVEMNFGTGALKVTPAHDPVDFEIAKRHGLRLDYQVIDKTGKMSKEAGIFAGQDVLTARENVVELLRSKGNLVKSEPYKHKVGYCERSKCRVETIVSIQWFINATEMAKKVIVGYKNKEFEIMPKRFEKVFEDWIYNLHDWCISRQLWWGHQIPAYYEKGTDKLLEVTTDEKSVFSKYGEENVYRDSDVLDTWFSSAMWPFSVLDWNPEKPGELYKKFYPAQVLETGHDIIFFWVIRMLLMGYEYTGQTPFKTIYLHGLIRDEVGRKMSKSLGNGIDPLDVIKEYSADSLRMTVVIGNTPGNDLKFSMKNVEGNNIFLNKLWNIARFVSVNVGEINKSYDDLQKDILKNYDKLLVHEKRILSKLRFLNDKMTKGMKEYNFSETGFDLIEFTKDEFADFYIEEYKLTKDESKFGQDVISFVLMTILKLWHPYVPYITEKIYQSIQDKEDLIDSAWPEIKISQNEKIEKDFEGLYDAIRVIRNIRTEKIIKPSELVDIYIIGPKARLDSLRENEIILKGLAKIDKLELNSKLTGIKTELMSFVVTGNLEIYIDTKNNDNLEHEIERLKGEISDKKEYIKIIDKKLLNDSFIRNAPADLVRKEQDKKAQAIEQLEKLKEKLININN